MSDKTLGKARGLNSIADPSEFRGVARRKKPKPEATASDEPPQTDHPFSPPTASTESQPPEQRRSTPQRKRRELSVPHVVSEAVEKTNINPADVVMSAYQKHSDAIFSGSGGRLASKGRSRLRLSLSDADFDKIHRLGEARGWNRSETVAVLLAFELLP